MAQDALGLGPQKSLRPLVMEKLEGSEVNGMRVLGFAARCSGRRSLMLLKSISCRDSCFWGRAPRK